MPDGTKPWLEPMWLYRRAISQDMLMNLIPNVCSEITLQWHHNECDGVSNHQPHDCLLIHVFRRRSKNMSKLPVTGLCAGNSPVTGEFPAQRPVTQKICPFDDVLNTFKITTAFPRVTWMNLLTFWKWGWQFKTHCNFQTQFCGHLSCEITFQWVPQNLGDEK